MSITVHAKIAKKRYTLIIISQYTPKSSKNGIP